jgi:hypothetical protein
VLVGALLGLIVVVAVFGYAAYVATSGPKSPDRDAVLVVALTEDSDGAQVAGFVGVVDWTPGKEAVAVIDPLTEVEGSGTSYTTLKDQYPFGGGQAVALAVAEGDEPLPWVVMPAEKWIELLDEAGGVAQDLERPVNAYVRGDLYILEEGEQTLSGGEVYALAADAMAIDASGTPAVTRSDLSSAVLESVRESWSVLVESVEDGDAESSLSAEVLQEMGE